MRRIDPDFSRRPPQAKKIWAESAFSITVGASWPQAVHGRLSRCKTLPLIFT